LVSVLRISKLAIPAVIALALVGCAKSDADSTDKSATNPAPVKAPDGFKGATPGGMGAPQPVGGGATDRAGSKSGSTG